jgi:2-polyprenyl-6-methoxyphenol hydroxylase-like FAD-dependent oxidoreductase
MIDVVIAGAGPTGLTLACDLARRGIGCRVLEAAPQLPPGSRGVTLKPRSLELFDDLGVVGRVLAGSHTESRTRYHFGGGEPADVRVPVAEPEPTRPYPNSVAIPQWRLRDILRDRFAELGGTVEFGRRVTNVSTGADSATVAIEDGELVEARYVVGADGGRSAVRGALGVRFDGDTHTSRALLADVHVTGLDRENGVHLWFAEKGHMVAARPLAHCDLWQFVGSVEGERQVEGDAFLATLQAIVTERTGRADIRLTDPTWVSLWRYNLRMVDRYRVGRVFLAGDAAHIHSPFGGHGMNTGVQDAHNLGWKLALVLQGIADDSLLDTYQAERLPVGKAILADSHQKMVTRTPPKEAIESKAREARQHQPPTYPHSPLTHHGAERGTVRAGEPTPDAPLEVDGQPTTLFDLLRGPHFTVLRFGPVHLPDLGEHVRVHDVTDSEGVLRQAFGAGTLVVVRPDGYVGLITDRPGGPAEYLREIGLDLPVASKV